MSVIRNIVKSIMPPEDTAEMWLDGEGKLRVYTLGAWKEVSDATEVNSEQVIKASQGYPYNAQYDIDDYPASNTFREVTFDGDLSVFYRVNGGTDLSLFTEGSFLANHVKKANIMGIDVEDIASLPSILQFIKNTYTSINSISVIFTLDTDTIEGDLFGINDGEVDFYAKPDSLCVNCKVKSLDFSHFDNSLFVSMLNSPTEILEPGSIKGDFVTLILPLALKNLEVDAFAQYTKSGNEIDSSVTFLIMPSLTVPESLPQSLSIREKVYFPALLGERTYIDYVKDVFNIDVKTSDSVLCFNVSDGRKIILHNQA